MLLDGNRARDVFIKVREVLEEIRQTCLAPDRPAISVEEFQIVIQRLFNGLPVTKYIVDYEATAFFGMIERYDDRVVIFVKGSEADLKDRLKMKPIRFIAVKELCHALIDDTADHSHDGVRTIHYLLEEYRVLKDTNAEAVAQSEVLAEVAAIEVMYPYNERCSDMVKVADGDLTMEEISDYYEIPIETVRRAFEVWFHDMATTIWSFVEQADAVKTAESAEG